jgi:hypothetical protein
MRMRTGDVYKLSHIGQPFWWCGSAISSMFTAFHHIFQRFEQNL